VVGRKRVGLRHRCVTKTWNYDTVYNLVRVSSPVKEYDASRFLAWLEKRKSDKGLPCSYTPDKENRLKRVYFELESAFPWRERLRHHPWDYWVRHEARLLHLIEFTQNIQQHGVQSEDWVPRLIYPHGVGRPHRASASAPRSSSRITQIRIRRMTEYGTEHDQRRLQLVLAQHCRPCAPLQGPPRPLALCKSRAPRAGGVLRQRILHLDSMRSSAVASDRSVVKRRSCLLF
jgi:hypothetical protein